MQGLSSKVKEINLTINTEDLTPTQVRLIKSMHSLMAHLMTSDEEPEYFETSADFLRKAAEVIKHSHFATKNKSIEYGEQAVEFAMDYLTESLDEKKIQNLDN